MLIVIGLLILWLAITGKLDRAAAAWDFLKGNTPALPAVGSSSSSASDSPEVAALSGILDPTTYHMQTMFNTLDPAIPSVKGGLL